MKNIENTIWKAALRRMTDMKIEFKIITGDMIKHFLFLLFLLLPIGKGFSQELVNYEVHRPSVNAEQFNIGASIQTSLSKGQPSVSIPLFELQGKGYNLPISLMFYGGDVNCETEASNIGLGWSLMAGGCITATVKDKEDTSITTMKDALWQFQDNYLESNVDNMCTISNMYGDLMPDELQYSIPGHQGTLELVGKNNLQKLDPKHYTINENCKIEWKLFPDETYKLEKTTKGYIITADDGTKFFFEDGESKQTYGMNAQTFSTAFFLTRIETVKGGFFDFHYADETMLDPHDEDPENDNRYGCHKTKRITYIESDFGSVTFTSIEDRWDRSKKDIHGKRHDTPSERITKIELKDSTGAVVRGYELKNDNYFTTATINNTPEINWDTRMDWSNYRLRLDSIIEYDASGHKLPPYVFTYDYKFGRATTCYNGQSRNDGNYKRGSWTKGLPYQKLINLNMSGQPACKGAPDMPNAQPEGISSAPNSLYHHDNMTVDDYFCLKSVKYPTGALDTFIYESHDYSNIAGNDTAHIFRNCVAGKRLLQKVSYDGSGDTQAKTVTEYIYKKHNSNYEADGVSSGVLTNPAFHYATRYTLGEVLRMGLGPTRYEGGLVANCISTDKPLNGYAGQPVYYREVEEVIMNSYGDILRRNIHYFKDNLLEPPVNYVYIESHENAACDELVTIHNFIYGKRTDYQHKSLSKLNNENYAYLAYPLGEFQQQTQDGELPLKEVTLDGDDRLILKKEFVYEATVDNIRYGYVFTQEDYTPQPEKGMFSDFWPNTNNVNTYTAPLCTVYNISRTARHAYRSHVSEIIETAYSYEDGQCDSIVTLTNYQYDQGRPTWICSRRPNESTGVSNFYPDMLHVGKSSGTFPEVQAVTALQQKNIIAKPIQTVRYNNGAIAEGHYSDYKVLPGGQIVPKAYYNLTLGHQYIKDPQVSNGAIEKNEGFYLQEEALAYDASLNPSHVSSRVSPDKVIVWGYGGRYPVAVIENYTEQQLNANSQLLSLLSQLKGYRKIGSQTAISALKSLNMNIRKSLPDGVLVKTYTYDPYAGLTSEFDYSGVGTIYTYDGFGRLAKVLDHNGSVISTNSYNYKKQ